MPSLLGLKALYSAGLNYSLKFNSAWRAASFSLFRRSIILRFPKNEVCESFRTFLYSSVGKYPDGRGTQSFFFLPGDQEVKKTLDGGRAREIREGHKEPLFTPRGQARDCQAYESFCTAESAYTFLFIGDSFSHHYVPLSPSWRFLIFSGILWSKVSAVFPYPEVQIALCKFLYAWPRI